MATSNVVAFSVGNAIAGTPNFFRERKADRKRRMAELVKVPLTFLCPVGEEAKKLVNGTSLTLLGSTLAIVNPESLRCVICHGVHGQPRKAAQLEGDNSWSAKNVAKIELFSQGGKLIVLSQTCVAEYLGPLAKSNPAIVTNYDDFAKFHGLPAKPVVKKQ